MVLQRMVTYDGRGSDKGLYIRASCGIKTEAGRILVPKDGKIRTYTYMNEFDLGACRKYTDLTDFIFVWRISGKGNIRVLREGKTDGVTCMAEMQAESGCGCREEVRHCVEGAGDLQDGLLYFMFRAEEESCLEAWIETETAVLRDVRISLVICTYKRRRQLERIINVLKAGKAETEREDNRKGGAAGRRGGREGIGENGWLEAVVIDNASELEGSYGDGIAVFHNPNTGGSGGFARGMEETVGRLGEYPATHVVLMDDDVVLQWESLCRLYALLSFVRAGYAEEAVAGRMFRMDRPEVQYTALEIWNGGDIRHIGWNRDMGERECLWDMNENRGGEYGGWWFACFPIGYVRKNSPLPFFLHCDDAEYGLRHGGNPIILNGIQVWHETYEYRQSPLTAYYDCRNAMVVNAVAGKAGNGPDELWQKFFGKISDAHNRGDFLLEYFLIRAFGDFLKGRKWFMHKDNARLHVSLAKKKRVSRYMNSFRWRKVYLVYRMRTRYWMKIKRNGTKEEKEEVEGREMRIW